MDPILYNLNDIYNKNILLLGRRASGKTQLLKKIINNLTFNKTYLVNICGINNIDEELNLPTYSVNNFNEIYNDIMISKGKKLLIFENFQTVYTLIQEKFNDLFKDILINKTYHDITIILVSNNLQLRLDTESLKSIDILFLSSVYFNINNFVNNLFNKNICENIFENLILKYIDNQKYLIFTKNLTYFY